MPNPNPRAIWAAVSVVFFAFTVLNIVADSAFSSACCATIFTVAFLEALRSRSVPVSGGRP